MVVRGGGDVVGHPGVGLQEGEQVDPVGVDPAGRVEGPEGVRVGIGLEYAVQGGAGRTYRDTRGVVQGVQDGT